MDAFRVPPVLTAHSQLDAGLYRASGRRRHPHQGSHALLVQCLERRSAKDPHFHVQGEERGLAVVTRKPPGCLRQVVGAEGEEVRGLRDLARGQRCARHLDHRADQIRHLGLGLLEDVQRDAVDDLACPAQLFEGSDQRHHDFRANIDALLLQPHRRLDDGARLHLDDLGKQEAEAATAEPEHRVLLVEVPDCGQEVELRAIRLLGLPECLCARDLDQQLLERRQEFVQRWIDEPDDHRQSVHRRENPPEVLTLHGEKLRQLEAAFFLVRRENHLLDDGKAFLLHEHVLGAAQADALGAEIPSTHGVVRVVPVGPHLKAAERIRPAQQLLELTGDLGVEHRHLSRDDVPGGTVDREGFAFLDLGPARGELALDEVDLYRLGSGDTGFAHAPRHHRRVRGAAPARGEHALGGDHAVDVVGVGLDAHEDDLRALLGHRLGAVRVEHGLAVGGAR